MYCRNCGKELDDKAVVCVGCGVPPLKGTKYCQSCGKEVPDDAQVCVSCGVPLAQGITVGAGDEKTWAMLAHLSMLVTWFIGPLVIYLTKGNESEFVKDQAREALNFVITCSICLFGLGVVGTVLTLVLWVFAAILPLFYLAVGVGALVLAIMAGIQANSGIRYRYPVSIRLIK